MKALVLTRTAPVEERPLELVERPVPVPGPGEILVHVVACGVCHTELDQIEGRLPLATPVIPGHQVVGRVESGGPGTSRFAAGDRVGVAWIYAACGHCRFCLTGRENLCPDARWTGKDADGGYAEYMVVPEAFAYPVPARFSDIQAAPLLCAGVIGYRALRLSGISDGDTLGLYGFGASAHLVLQAVRHAFPRSPVFVFTRGDAHRELARALGAEWVGGAGDTPPAPLRAAIDFTPVGATVRAALGALEPGGRLVLNVIRKRDPIPELDYATDLWHEKEVKSVANLTRQDAEEFLRLADAACITPSVQAFGLHEAHDALLRLKEGRIRAAAVLDLAR